MENQNTTNANNSAQPTDAEVNQWIIQSAVEQFAPVVTEGKTKEVPKVEGGTETTIIIPITPEERIAQAKQMAETMVIADNKDPQYKTAKTFLTAVKKWRTGVENKRKELKKVALEYGSKVDGEAKRLTALIEPVEKAFMEKIAAIDKAAEQAAKAEELRRHKLMTENGWQFTGSWYVCGIANLTQGDLAAATEEKLTALVAEGNAETQRVAAETLRKEQEAADAKIESDKVAAENERLRKEIEALKQNSAPKVEMAPDPEPIPRMFVDHPRPEGFELPPNTPGVTTTIKHTTGPAYEVKTTPAPTNPAHPDDMAGMFAAATIGGLHEPEEPEEFVKPRVGSVTAFDYDKGFNDCRNQVLALFADGVKRTREQWVTIFNELKPSK